MCRLILLHERLRLVETLLVGNKLGSPNIHAFAVAEMLILITHLLIVYKLLELHLRIHKLTVLGHKTGVVVKLRTGEI